VITVADLEDRIARLDTFARARYSSAEQKRRFLENWIRVEVMAKEARARGYDRDADVQRVMKNQLIAVLLQREVDDKLKAEDIPLAEVQAYYDQNLDDFRRPDQVRVSQIFTAELAKAQQAADAAARAPATDKAFREIVDRFTEDEDSKARGGDLTFFDQKSTLYPSPVVSGAFALKEIGAVSPPIRSDKGWHLLRLTQRRPGFTRPMAEVQSDVRRRIVAQRRERRIEELVAEMRKKLKVEIYEDQLAKVVVKPAQTETGARP